MNKSDQNQSAGDNANQTQIVGGTHYHLGITEARAKEIAKEVLHDVVMQYSREGQQLAAQNMDLVTEAVIGKLAAANSLDLLGKPRYQRLFELAAQSAAISEEPENLDLLMQLLAEKEMCESKVISTAMIKATEIAGLVDPVALNGLTAMRAITYYSPSSGEIRDGLATLEQIYGDLFSGPLPNGSDWLDHLDSLGIIRLSPKGLTQRVKFEQYFPEKMLGYVARALTQEEFDVTFNEEAGLGQLRGYVIPHQLIEGKYRLGIVSIEQLKKILLESKKSEAEIKNLLEVCRLRFGFGEKDANALSAYFEEIKVHEAIARAQAWWDFTDPFELTAVGVTLARANLKRLDKRRVLPDLE